MTSLPGGQNYASLEVERTEPRRRSSGFFVWAALALLVVGAIVIGIFGVRRVLNKQNDAVATSSPETLVAENTSSPTDSSQVPTTTTSTASTEPESNRSNVNANQNEIKTSSPPEAKVIFSPAPPAPGRADPVLFPPDNRQTPETREPSATDYDRIFRRSEVDSPVRIVLRPAPSYTESARKNQVVGVVVLRTVFTSSGSVTNISVIRGLQDGLSERAIAAAKQIKFTPAMKDGRPVSTWVQLEYNFNLY